MIARSENLLTARGITVRYGATRALDDVDLEVGCEQVHAVVGENGAGKSTLLRVVAGATAAENGTIRFRAGSRCAWVPQDPVIPSDLTACEWIFLGDEWCGALRTLRRRAMHRAAFGHLRAAGCDIDPGTRIAALSGAQRKQLQLARALRQNPTILLLDEPTALLGAEETRRLFEAIRTLRKCGAAVLYVSHRLDEVREIADIVTVLRDGRRVSCDPVASVDGPRLVQRMVGRELVRRPRKIRRTGHEVLRIENLSAAHVHVASLPLHEGEIVGLAGLVGSGRSELLEAIAGLRTLLTGKVHRRDSAALVPEDRLRKGLVPTLGVRENLFLPASRRVLRQRLEKREAKAWITAMRIRPPSVDAPIASLSGGNQQKLLLARALRRRPKVLLLDEPTAGIDIGAQSEIHELIVGLAERGTAILIASSALPELLALCDRVVAMRCGQVVGEVASADASEAQLAAWITGAGDGAAGTEKRAQ